MAGSEETYSILWESNPTGNRVGVDYSLVTFSGDGSAILVLFKDNELQLLSATDGLPIGESWPISDDRHVITTPWILDIALSHNGRVAMAASTDGDIRLWQLDRRDQAGWKQTSRVVDNGVLAKAVLSSNALIIAAVSRFSITGSQPQKFGTTLNVVRLTATGEVVERSLIATCNPGDRFISAGFSNGSRILAAVTLKKRVLEIGMDDGSRHWNPDPDTVKPMTQSEVSEKDPGRSTLCFSPNDSSIATTLGPSIRIWNRSENHVHFAETIECEVRTQYTPVLCSYSNGGDMLAVSFDSQIKIFSTSFNGTSSLPISRQFLEGAFLEQFSSSSRGFICWSISQVPCELSDAVTSTSLSLQIDISQ